MLSPKDVWLMQLDVIYWYTSREEAQAGREKKNFNFSCLALKYEFYFINMNLYLIPNKIKWKIGIQNSVRMETSICIQIWLNPSDLLTTPDALLNIKFCINLRWCF